MCTIVVINRGEKEIETPRQFKDHFGFLPDGFEVQEDLYPEGTLDECLCHAALDETFDLNSIPYKRGSDGDYYVGMLEGIV